MLTVYMDESGFTGEDLLSPDQPIFVHVSATLPDSESGALYREFFAGTQASELKHRTLSKRLSGRKRVAAFIRAIQGMEQFTVWTCHKEFTLLTYLVDLWVEPAMQRNGVDLYRDGGNLALCNMIYYCLRTFQSEQFLLKHLQRFQTMMLKRTPKTYREFFEGLLRDYLCVDQRSKDVLVFFLGAGMKLDYSHLFALPERALDPAFTTAVQTCGHWRKCTDQRLRLVHDRSSNLAKDKWLWDLITSPELERRTIGVPGREFTYPLRVAETEFADSRSHLQLQFCDVVAGATVQWYRQFVGVSHDEEYVTELGKAGIEELTIGAIWPQPEVTPEGLGMKGWSSEGVEFLAEQLKKRAPGSRPGKR